MTPEIFARLAPLPAKVKAVVLTDDYMMFTIFVSEYLCEESRRKALMHELRHIYEDHFTNEVIPLAQLERLANQIDAGYHKRSALTRLFFNHKGDW